MFEPHSQRRCMHQHTFNLETFFAQTHPYSQQECLHGRTTVLTGSSKQLRQVGAAPAAAEEPSSIEFSGMEDSTSLPVMRSSSTTCSAQQAASSSTQQAASSTQGKASHVWGEKCCGDEGTAGFSSSWARDAKQRAAHPCQSSDFAPPPSMDSKQRAAKGAASAARRQRAAG